MKIFSRTPASFLFASISFFILNFALVYSQEDYLTRSENPAPKVMTFGSPQYNPIVVRDGYVVSYDSRNKNPYWVYEYLTKENFNGPGNRNRSDYTEDEDGVFPDQHKALLEDYKYSGYDRGHLAPAADHKTTQKTMDDTFYLSNMAPQVGAGFNSGIWRTIENSVRKLLKDRSDVHGLHVVSGSLYLPIIDLPEGRKGDEKSIVVYPVIGESKIAVPTHFFKVILAEKNEDEFEEYAVLIRNEPVSEKKASDFAVTIEKIEKLSGLVFFREANIDGVRPNIDRTREPLAKLVGAVF